MVFEGFANVYFDQKLWNGEFLRVKVYLDVRRPLLCRVSVKTRDYGEFDIACKYEKILTHCHRCGLMGHISRDCETDVSEDNVFGYGEWLRAESRTDDPNFYIRVDATIELEDEVEAIDVDVHDQHTNTFSTEGRTEQTSVMENDHDLEGFQSGVSTVPVTSGSAFESNSDQAALLESGLSSSPLLLNSSGSMEWTSLPLVGSSSLSLNQAVMVMPNVYSSPSYCNPVILKEQSVNEEIGNIAISSRKILEHLTPISQAFLTPISSVILQGMGESSKENEGGKPADSNPIIICESPELNNEDGKGLEINNVNLSNEAENGLLSEKPTNSSCGLCEVTNPVDTNLGTAGLVDAEKSFVVGNPGTGRAEKLNCKMESSVGITNLGATDANSGGVDLRPATNSNLNIAVLPIKKRKAGTIDHLGERSENLAALDSCEENDGAEKLVSIDMVLARCGDVFVNEEVVGNDKSRIKVEKCYGSTRKRGKGKVYPGRKM